MEDYGIEVLNMSQVSQIFTIHLEHMMVVEKKLLQPYVEKLLDAKNKVNKIDARGDGKRKASTIFELH